MFQFVTVTHPDEIKDRQRQKKLREHAIRSGIQRSKAKKLKDKGDVVACHVKDGVKEHEEGVREESARVALTRTPSISLLDPFDTITRPSGRLRGVRLPSTKQTDKAVICTTNNRTQLLSQNIPNIFKSALAEPFLIHALSLTHTLSSNNPLPTIEVLAHRGHLLAGIRNNIKNQNNSTPEVSTFVAMLILIGYEYSIDGANAESIETHIKAVQAMMKICKERNVVLVERVQKALFWQDLLSCLMSGTGRVMRHGDFVDFRIKRRSDWEGKYVVPPGLATVCQGWADEFVVVLEDLNALCARIDEECVQDTTPVDILPIENYQASLESRVVDCISDFRKSGIPDDPLQEACMYATYMCIYKLSLGVWEGCYIPEVCVSQIFRCVTLLVQDSRINQCRGICLWLLCFAGMMTTRKEARQRVCELIHTIMDPDTGIKTNDWTTARYVMRQFIWCNYAFEQPVRDFWNHFISVQSQAKKQFPKSIYKPTHQQNRTTQLRANIKI